MNKHLVDTDCKNGRFDKHEFRILDILARRIPSGTPITVQFYCIWCLQITTESINAN